MNVINGIIVNQGLIEGILEAGFACLGELSPFKSGKTVVFTCRMSMQEDYVVWRAYLYEDNTEHIKNVGDGAFEVGVMAKHFASLSNSDGYININAGVKEFNQLEAIRFCDELY